MYHYRYLLLSLAYSIAFHQMYHIPQLILESPNASNATVYSYLRHEIPLNFTGMLLLIYP